MLKNKLWIVALFAALTMAFIGCTDADHGWEAPVEELAENALQVRPLQSWAGFDLNQAKFNFSAGDVIQVTGKALSANTVHISRNHQAWAPIWDQRLNPDEEFDSGKVTLTAADVSSIAGLNPAAIRVYGNTPGATFIIYNITVTRGGEEIFNFYEIYLKDLKPGTTDPNVIFPDADNKSRSEAWITTADGENNSHNAAIFTILGPGYGGAAATPTPEYKGDPTKVVFTAGATAIADKVEDNDPSVTGSNVSIDSNGVITFKDGGSVSYKFPTGYITGSGKKAVTNPLALESDYDLIDIDYTISSLDLTTGSTFKIKATQYGSGWDGTKYVHNNAAYAEYLDLGGAGTYSGATALKVQTWGAGGKGGIDISYNTYDIAGTVKIKINKVTFTKGTRYTVKYLTPTTPNLNNIASQTVLSGNPPRVPSLSNPGWVFLGWFDTWGVDATGNNGEASGTQYDANSTITDDITLYAKWLRYQLPNYSATPTTPATGTLFSAVGSYDAGGADGTGVGGTANTSAGTTYTYPTGATGKDYWIVANGHSGNYAWDNKVEDFPQADFDAIHAQQGDSGSTPGYTRIGIDLSTINADWDKYTQLTVTYEMIPVGGSGDGPTIIQVRNQATGGGGAITSAFDQYKLTAGTGTFTVPVALIDPTTKGITIVKNTPSGALLLRITKIELHY